MTAPIVNLVFASNNHLDSRINDSRTGEPRYSVMTSSGRTIVESLQPGSAPVVVAQIEWKIWGSNSVIYAERTEPLAQFLRRVNKFFSKSLVALHVLPAF